jgi:hypothetical protein
VKSAISPRPILNGKANRLAAEANENRVRVDLSLKFDMAKPESNTRGEMFCCRIAFSMLAT